MRVAIINSSYELSDEYYDLGAAAVANVIHASENHDVCAIDFMFEWENWQNYLKQKLLEFKPELIGLSTYSPRIAQALKVARMCKAILPEVRIVMGGHHASLGTAETLAQDCVDYVVVGEAENTILQLLDVLESKQLEKLYDIPFLGFKSEKGEIVENKLGKLPTAEELTNLPFIDWSIWEHHKKAIYHCGFLPIIGVRGCPYKCTFCSSPILANRLKGTGPFVRESSAVKTAQEALYLWEKHKDDGLRYLMFYDQNFLMNKQWLEDFSKEYIRLGLNDKLPFSCYSRLDHLTPEKLKLARDAGCIQLRVGIESGNEAVRNNLLNKRLTQSMLLEKMKMLNDSGINALGYFIIGNPNETFSQAFESFRMAKRVGLKRAAFFFLTPLHNLPLQKDKDVDYIDMDMSMGFSIATGLDNRLSTYSKTLLVLLFYFSNGWFLLKTFFGQIKSQGFSFIWGFPGYLRQARKDGFDMQKSALQYIYYHGDSFLY